MAVEAKIRAQLQDSFAELWDERRARFVMELMAPDLSGLATEADLREIGKRLEQAIAACATKQEFNALREAIGRCATKEELNRLLSQLREDQRQRRGEFHGFRTEIHKDQHQLRGEFQAFRTEIREGQRQLRGEFRAFREAVERRIDQREAKVDARLDKHEAERAAKLDKHEIGLDAKFGDSRRKLSMSDPRMTILLMVLLQIEVSIAVVLLFG